MHLYKPGGPEGGGGGERGGGARLGGGDVQNAVQPRATVRALRAGPSGKSGGCAKRTDPSVHVRLFFTDKSAFSLKTRRGSTRMVTSLGYGRNSGIPFP
eukprot:9182751-Pyramimonas_sp.AAC.1